MSKSGFPDRVYTNSLQRDELRAVEELKKASALFGDEPKNPRAKAMRERRIARMHDVLRQCKALDNSPSFARGLLFRLPIVYINSPVHRKP